MHSFSSVASVSRVFPLSRRLIFNTPVRSFRPSPRSTSSSTPFSSFQRSQSTSSSPPARPNLHTNFYRTHGRALFKSLTMAFLSYQIFYWIWNTLEMETMKDEKTQTIKALEEEVRLLGSGVGSHGGGKRLLEVEGNVKK